MFRSKTCLCLLASLTILTGGVSGAQAGHGFLATSVIPTPETIAGYIHERPDETFKDPGATRKRAFGRKLNVVIKKIDKGRYAIAIRELEKIREKTDGAAGGKVGDDWIIDPDTQQGVTGLIDALIAYLETL